jgi:hypothetical protein
MYVEAYNSQDASLRAHTTAIVASTEEGSPKVVIKVWVYHQLGT